MRYERLQLVLQKLLESLRVSISEIDASAFFPEYAALGKDIDLDMPEVADVIVRDLQRSFASVLKRLDVKAQLDELDRSGSLVLPIDTPEDAMRSHTIRRKLHLKSQLEAQLAQIDADNLHKAALLDTLL